VISWNKTENRGLHQTGNLPQSNYSQSKEVHSKYPIDKVFGQKLEKKEK
jgi:hypothetical protein